jgi:hypothetical protein
VTFSIDPASASVCSISGATVTFNQAGSCVIDANQAGDAKYQAAPQAQQTATDQQITQTIKFSRRAPTYAVPGDTYKVRAKGGGSGNPVIITIDQNSKLVCSFSNGTVTFNNVGSCVIDANQAGNARYQAAPQAQHTVTVYIPIQ